MSAALTTDVDKRLLRTTKFPPEFNVKVDMTKVNIPVIKKWVSDEIVKILQNEDDVVTDLVFNLIEGPRYPNIKELQISLNGFLDRDAPKFCDGLWKLCLSAQENPQGIPKELLEAKKLELVQERIEEDRAREDARKRQEAERERERDMARIRDRERNERDRGRGGRYGRDYDRRAPRRDSRSPPPRRRDDDASYRRGTDSYVPTAGRRRDDRPPPRRRSPSGSRSPSPPRRRRRSTPSASRSPPPRRRRDDSSDRSVSRDRGHDRRDRRGDQGRKAGSPADRRRSRSPRRRHHHHRRSSPKADYSRSPPSRRTRRPSPSRSRSPPRGILSRDRPSESRSRSRSPPSRGKKRSAPAANDLIAKPRRDDPRLSRETSSHSDTPPARERKRRGSLPRFQPSSKRRRNTSSVESSDRKPANGDAEESGFSILHAANVHRSRQPNIQRATQPALPSVIVAPSQPQERRPNPRIPQERNLNQKIQDDLRKKLLKEKFIKDREAGKYPTLKRKDSAVSTDTGKS